MRGTPVQGLRQPGGRLEGQLEWRSKGKAKASKRLDDTTGLEQTDRGQLRYTDSSSQDRGGTGLRGRWMLGGSWEEMGHP